MKTKYRLVAVAVLLGGVAANAPAQTVFNENFDGGYSGGLGLSHYSGGSPTGTSSAVITSGGNPNGAWRETMTTTTTSDFYAGQLQLDSVSGNTDVNPSDYVFSFDAYGSQAANLQVAVQTWPNANFGGTGPVVNATFNVQLAAANTWQTFSVNLGGITTAIPTGATWQLAFQINAYQWGGAGFTDTLTIDNIILTHIVVPIALASSANPSTFGQAVSFTATVQTNGVTAGNATGKVVFSSAAGPFSTNTLSAGHATSAVIANLPVGSNMVTAIYSGGNYPASTNTLGEIVNPAQNVSTRNLPVYTDNPVNGFQDSSWATVNLANNSPIHSGSYSVSVTDGGNYQALNFVCPAFNSSPYASLDFWINGGSTGGQRMQVWAALDGSSQAGYPVGPLPANTWQEITIPLSTLGAAGVPNFTGIGIQGNDGGAAQPTFYVDDMQLLAAPAPATVHLGVDASQVLRTVDARQFGLNTATWDGSLANAQTLPLLKEMGCLTLRWPGGSTSDGYNWASDATGNAAFQNIATNLGAQVFTTVNYGTGTAAEAAAWVLSANQTNHCSFKYWEVGNECYGSWETDSHAAAHDPYTYATNAAAYIQQMKAAYPAVPIKVGVVVVPGEDSYVNNYSHSADNPVTSSIHYGWTPIVLSEMKALGVLPDFLIYHFYPQDTPPGWTYFTASADSDALLLQVAGNPAPLQWTDWASAAANLRQQITDYIGPAGASIELCVTENNSDAQAMGRQSTSLVNALYLADSTSRLMKTEFNSCIFWDLRNGAETDGDFDPTIYGWRTFGDYGVLSAANTQYPAFYAEKLLQYFARPGDSVLNAASDNLLLSAYAVRRTNGSLTLLVINKDMTTNLGAQIALTNFVPWTSATIQSYGIPQDQAAEANAGAASQDLATTNFSAAGTNFTYSFPPLSLTLFTFAPAPAALSASGRQPGQPGQVTLLLQGQPGAPYVLQSSPDLVSWTSLSTNTPASGTANLSIPVASLSPQQFYRAVWQP